MACLKQHMKVFTMLCQSRQDESLLSTSILTGWSPWIPQSIFHVVAGEIENSKVILTVFEKPWGWRDGVYELEFLELDMFKSEEVGELIVRGQANAGEGGG